jgi:hypothetical protein
MSPPADPGPALLAATVLVFTARPIWWPPTDDDAALRYNPPQQALAAAYFLLGVTILAWHAHMVWSQRLKPGPQAVRGRLPQRPRQHGQPGGTPDHQDADSPSR